MDYGDTTVTSESYCQRQAQSVCSMCCGLFMVPLCIMLIFFTENDAVRNYATAKLVYGAKPVWGCDPSHYDDDQLVLAACNAYGPQLSHQLPTPLRPFLPSFYGSYLGWDVEILQNTEEENTHCEKDNQGGKKCYTTYTCHRRWVSDWVDSASFRCAERYVSNYGHTMPMNLRTGSTTPPEYSVVLSSDETGVPLRLDRNLMSQIPSNDLSGSLYQSMPSTRWQRTGGHLMASMLYKDGSYLVTSPSPQIGDLRISVSGSNLTRATVAAMQHQGGSDFILGPFPSQPFGWFGKRTKPLEKLEPGILTHGQFVKQWNSEIQFTIWVLRFVELILMIVAFELIFQPLSVAADLLRVVNYCTCCLGSILDNAAQCVIHTVAISMAIVLTLVTIAIAWIVARPGLGLSLIAVAVGVYVGVLYLHGQQKTSARTIAVSDLSTSLAQEASHA